MSNLPSVDQDLVTIRMNNTNFSAMKPLLANSSFFFSDLFNPRKFLQPSDGVYNIYGRDDMFQYILQYCHSHMYPLLFSEEKGFDKIGYTVLLGESIRFGIKDLTEWIKGAKYTEMIQMHLNVEKIKIENELNIPNILFNSNQTVSIQPFEWTENVYKCPRNVNVHRGHPEYCGKECHRVMPESGPTYEPVSNFGVMLTKKSFTINYEALMPVMMGLSEDGYPGEENMQP